VLTPPTLRPDAPCAITDPAWHAVLPSLGRRELF
jgi:hypothetical protein